MSKVWVSEPDSAGGVKLYVNFENKSEKEIKYAYFDVAMYNAVGDIDLGKYTTSLGNDKDYVSLCATGPFKKGEGLSGTREYWGKYYSFQIKTAKLLGVTIQYMDGTERTLTPEEIQY
ncbi:MAG: hypothetical protein K6F93_04930 [Lachnospiraceae bacterium]|nr:hypothetical protein [Lachnospiraceae bacterium]